MNKLTITWLDMFLKYIMSFLLLPLAGAYLSAEELAFFLFINTITGIAYVAEGGVNRAILRAMTYYNQGMDKIPFKYSNDQCISKVASYEKIEDLINLSLYIYLVLGFFSSIILFTIGGLATEKLILKQPNLFEAELTYYLLILFVFLHVMSLRWVGLLQGSGVFFQQKKIEVGINLFRLLLICYSLLKGYVVIGVVVSMVLSAILSNSIYFWFFNKIKPTKKLSNSKKFDFSVIHELWPSSWRQALMAWGGYFIYQGTSLIAIQLDDVALVASYLLTMQVITALKNISNAPSYAFYPNIVEAVSKHDANSYKVLLFRVLLLSMACYLIGATLVLFFGEFIFNAINSQTNLLPLDLLVFIIVVYLLELHHVVHAGFYTATNHIPFVVPAILSGAGIILVSYLVIDEFGLLGLISTHFFIQLLFNNWYPVYKNRMLLKEMSK